MRKSEVLEVCISSAMGWWEVRARSPFLLFVPGECLSCLGQTDVRNAEASRGIEQKEVAEFNNQHHKRHLSQCITLCSFEALPEPFPLSYLLLLITGFTYCPTGEQKGHVRFIGKEVSREQKPLTCMQTVTAAVRVTLTIAARLGGWRQENSVEGSQDPFSSQDRELLKAVQNLFSLIPAYQAGKAVSFYHRRRAITSQPATSLLHSEWHFRRQPVGPSPICHECALRCLFWLKQRENSCWGLGKKCGELQQPRFWYSSARRNIFDIPKSASPGSQPNPPQPEAPRSQAQP